MSEQYKTDWHLLFHLIVGRLKNAFLRPSFLFCFVFLIMFVGGSGIWGPYAFDSTVNKLFRADALITYCIAIISSIFVDYLLENDMEISSKGLALLTFGITSISFSMLIYSYVKKGTEHEANYGLWGTIFTLVIWFFFNANNPKYDEVKKSASLGGETPTKGGLR